MLSARIFLAGGYRVFCIQLRMLQQPCAKLE